MMMAVMRGMMRGNMKVSTMDHWLDSLKVDGKEQQKEQQKVGKREKLQVVQLVDLWENLREHLKVDLLVAKLAVKRDKRKVVKMV